MIVKKAEFIKSSPDYTLCPQSNLPEYAFIGRSNVGKSSLINMLTNRRKLAQVSSTPGKTVLINHFLINDEWHLVDLPGYGYAKTYKSKRDELRLMIEDYILKRKQLTLLFVLVDGRHEPQNIDIDFINGLGENQAPFALIFTKADKLSKSALNRNIDKLKSKLSEMWEEIPPIFAESAETGAGKEEILDYVEKINRSLCPISKTKIEQ
ncbi:MAG: ribosome biogenesis GTP-binding protein YihA/YsxC [Prevotellaceae bacterium]|jgi:GTP-binding protein|nr:ribosome biogenesis GTP-binding protein YihA/YsxC [Prevotellaceae bacterium]